MLPYFKSTAEAARFLRAVNGRAKTVLLLETPEAVACLDDILALDGIDEMYIGLNDLSIGYHRPFLFEILADGTVDTICEKFRARGIPFGFGGIAALGRGDLPSEHIIADHYLLGSSSVILSRSFCNVNRVADLDTTRIVFNNGVQSIREYEAFCQKQPASFFEKNHRLLQKCVSLILTEKIER